MCTLSRLVDFGFYLMIVIHMIFYDSYCKALLINILKKRKCNLKTHVVRHKNSTQIFLWHVSKSNGGFNLLTEIKLSSFHPCDLFTLLISSIAQICWPCPHNSLDQRQILDPRQSTPKIYWSIPKFYKATQPKWPTQLFYHQDPCTQATTSSTSSCNLADWNIILVEFVRSTL